MQNLLKLEQAAIFGLSILIFSQTDFSWWWYPALILLPDLGMFGYAFNNKTGAFTYNLFHHQAVAIVVLCLGWYLLNEWTTLAGIILLGHSAMDRMIGYGLKFNDSFHHTHLGWLKPENNEQEISKT